MNFKQKVEGNPLAVIATTILGTAGAVADVDGSC
jgi:hypothetical protein